MLSQPASTAFCKTPTNAPASACDYTNFTGSIDPIYLATFEPVVINLFFWEIFKSNGTLDTSTDPDCTNTIINDFEKEALDVVAAANQFYNPSNIYFKYLGYDEIDSDYLANTANSGILIGDIGDEIYVAPTGNFLNLDDMRRADAYNIYVSANPCTGGGAAYGLNYPLHVQSRGSFVDRLDHALHEIGHSLGLFHTMENFFYQDEIVPGVSAPGCEASTRITTNALFNANSHGDRVVDTNAVPLFRSEEYYEHYWEYMDAIANPVYQDHLDARDYAELNFVTEYKYVANCKYIGNSKDCWRTDQYVITPEDIRNFMLYRPDDCDDDLKITTGQAIRIRETIDLDCKGALAASINTTGVDGTGLASLFEPYKGEYYQAGPLPPVYATYQPGFDYKFIDCSCQCDQPTDYNPIPPFTYNSSNIVATYGADFQDYDAITHPNHSAMIIEQLQSEGVLPQRCYDNHNRAPSGGNVTRFNDGIFNTNVTHTPQDSTQINNPQLIQNLQPGLYTIRKDFDDGTSENTNVFKEGNN